MITSLSVVIPSYNEEANIEKCLKSVHLVLKKLQIDWEIIVVNDGSRDNTSQIVRKLAQKIPNLILVENKPNKGYGGALKAGFATASKEYIAFFPADNQFDFAQISLLITCAQETDCDIVSGIRVVDRDPPIRKFFRWGWNTLVRGLFGYLASDVDCGFKLFKREILARISLPSDGAMIDTELFAGLRARRGKVEEIPVKHLPRMAGESTGGNPKVIIKALRELLLFWWQLKHEIRVERGKAVFRWEVILMILILGAAAFMRLYKIDEYMTFLGDEGRDVTIVRDMVLGRKFTLIGPGTSIGNMYLGPLYYYLMIPSLAIWQLSPVGPAVMIAGFGLLTIALMWWMGRQWFGRTEALMVALLYAVSPTIITYSRSSWNPNIMPFFALLAMYCIWKVWKYGYWRWLVVAAVSMAMVLNAHYLGLLLIPPMGIYWLASQKKGSWRQYTIFSMAVFLLLMSPLVIFDLRHGGTNYLAMKTFFTDRQTTVNLKIYKSIPLLWPLWQQILSTLATAGNAIVAAVTGIGLLVLMALGLKEKQLRGDIIFLLTWIAFGVVGLGVYKQHIYAHYFGFLFPAIYLGLGFALQTLFKNKFGKVIGLVAVAVLLALNLLASPLRYPPNNQLAHTKQIANFITRESGDLDFNLALLSKNNYDMSYRYFLTEENAKMRTIHEKITDQLFVICEESTCLPLGNPLWEIAAYGWAKIDREWEFPWGVRLIRLVHSK